MTTIELDDQAAERYKNFCQHEQELMAVQQNWKDLRKFAENMQFGAFTLVIKDGKPVRIDNPMQQIVLGHLTIIPK